LILEKVLRGRKKFSYTTTKVRPITRQKLVGVSKIAAFTYCLGIFSFGFLVPTLQLVHWSILTYKKILTSQFWQFIFNSIYVAFLAAAIIIIIALVVANYCRINENLLSKIYSKITVIGYSIPGAVIAIGVIVFFINYSPS